MTSVDGIPDELDDSGYPGCDNGSMRFVPAGMEPCYGGGEEVYDQAATSRAAPTRNDELISTIGDFLKGTPLRDEAEDVFDDSQYGGLNPYLVVAIAGAESGFVSRMVVGSNNPFGLLHPVTGKDGNKHYLPIKYGNLNDAINAAVSTIDKQFLNGNVTVAEIYSGLPGAYCRGTCLHSRKGECV